MIVCIAATQRAPLALVIRQCAATKRRRTDDGHHSQERKSMTQPRTSADTLDQIRSQARLSAIAQARAQRTFGLIRQLISDLADDASTSGLAAGTIETLTREVGASLPCEHPARALRYIGLHHWTGGPDSVHAAECSRIEGGCGQVIVLERSGDAHAVVSGGSRFMPSTLAG